MKYLEKNNMEQQMVFISGNIPSSKNSKVATSRGVFHSKTVSKWLRMQGIQHYSSGRKEVVKYKTIPFIFPVEELKKLFESNFWKTDNYKEEPIKIGLHFVRDKKTKFDFHNACQIIFDLLVAFDIIDDDNMDCVIPYAHKINGKYYSIDKLNPGCWITIL